MTAPLHDRRADVIDAAKVNGWSHAAQQTEHGAISDEFERGTYTLRCFWSTTPWSPDGHWDNGVLYGPDGPRQVATISKEHGVLAVLRS